MDCKGIQEGPPTLNVHQEGFGALGKDEEATARIAPPCPDGSSPRIRFVYMNAGLRVDVDVQTGEGEAG
jgi:hypothetical protein